MTSIDWHFHPWLTFLHPWMTSTDDTSPSTDDTSPAIHGWHPIIALHPWMRFLHPWIEYSYVRFLLNIVCIKLSNWKGILIFKILCTQFSPKIWWMKIPSMDESAILGCHPWMEKCHTWMSSMDGDDGWQTWTEQKSCLKLPTKGAVNNPIIRSTNLENAVPSEVCYCARHSSASSD